MKTNQLSELQQNGFTVHKTRDYTTVIKNNKPFNIHGESGIISASLNEQQQYVVTFAGLCVNGQTPNLIEQSPFPMIADVQQRALKQELNPTYVVSEQSVKYPVNFTDLVEGELFNKSADQTSTYRKVSETTYVKTDSLIEQLEMIAGQDMSVFVVEAAGAVTGLSLQQKQMIVDSLPDDLQRYDFDEVLGMTLEDIPGVENMSNNTIARLHKELYKMYVDKNK